jgi:HupE / UreJ protein
MKPFIPLRTATQSMRLALPAMLCLLLSLASPAWAHKASDAYLQLGEAPAPTSQSAASSASDKPTALQYSIALRDLDAAIDTLDVDNNRSLEWGEVRQNLPAIQAWVGQGLLLQCDGKDTPLSWAFESLEQRSDGAYIRLGSTAACPRGDFVITYQLMQNVDSTHRLLVGGQLQGQSIAAVASPQNKPTVNLRAASAPAVQGGQGTQGVQSALPAQQSGPAAFAQFFPEGIHHIATGYDHLAFLLALMLPIVLRRGSDLAQAAQTPHHQRPGLVALLRTVTGFTIGHCITLVTATLGWITPPTWVEPAIAVSIGVSAWLNLYPVRWLRQDVLALGFGLVHGLGFSGLMREANVSDALLPWALAGFNLGVEAGQIAGVLVWCSLHWVVARWQRYEQVVVRGGSWALLALASYWTLQRLSSA